MVWQVLFVGILGFGLLTLFMASAVMILIGVRHPEVAKTLVRQGWEMCRERFLGGVNDKMVMPIVAGLSVGACYFW